MRPPAKRLPQQWGHGFESHSLRHVFKLIIIHEYVRLEFGFLVSNLIGRLNSSGFEYMKNKQLSVGGRVEIFPVENPWVYLRVPKKYTDKLQDLADRGLVPITVTLGKSVWDTSLMPMGDGTQFIPLNAKVRKAEGINVGDHVKLTFVLRKR